jgi:hypothetical protein
MGKIFGYCGQIPLFPLWNYVNLLQKAVNGRRICFFRRAGKVFAKKAEYYGGSDI